jgi:hypothetical protein
MRAKSRRCRSAFQARNLAIDFHELGGLDRQKTSNNEIREMGARESLAAAEAVEFRHGAFHFFASGVGGGANALYAETEIVRV